PTITNTLRLLNLPDPIKESLARGDITEGHARSLLGIPDPVWQERVWRRIVEENLSVRDAERLSRSAGPPQEPAPDETSSERPRPVPRETKPRKRQSDPDLAAMEDALRLALGTRVRIQGDAESGRILIDYYGPEDLERIAGLLGME